MNLGGHVLMYSGVRKGKIPVAEVGYKTNTFDTEHTKHKNIMHNIMHKNKGYKDETEHITKTKTKMNIKKEK